MKIQIRNQKSQKCISREHIGVFYLIQRMNQCGKKKFWSINREEEEEYNERIGNSNDDDTKIMVHRASLSIPKRMLEQII